MDNSINQPSRIKSFFSKNIPWILLSILAVCLVSVFFSPTDNWSWDPSFYYAQLRSPIVDHDLDFQNETMTGAVTLASTEKGLQPSPWPIGPGVLWSPFFIVAHVMVSIYDPKLANGYVFPYISLVAFGSMFYGALGLAVIYKICRLYCARFTATITTILALAATPLFFYFFQQPIMAHTTGLFASACLVYCYLLFENGQINPKHSGLIFGVFLGLNVLTRWAGVIFVIVPLVYYSRRLVHAARTGGASVRSELSQLGIFAVVFALTVSPQISLWYRLHGQLLVFPQGAGSFVRGALPANLIKVLFATNRGVVWWSPFIAIGLVGLFWIKPIYLRVTAVACCFTLLIVLGYRDDWFSGGGFGARYFIETLPFVSLGFVALVSRMESIAWGRAIMVLLSLVLIVHQLTLLFAVEQAYDLKWIDLGDYLGGKALGLRWQLDSFVRLVKSPEIWFLPRIDTRIDRQSILVNLMNGVGEIKYYRAQMLVLVLTPIFCAAFWGIGRKFHRSAMLLASSVILLLMVFWSVFLLLVG